LAEPSKSRGRRQQSQETVGAGHGTDRPRLKMAMPDYGHTRGALKSGRERRRSMASMPISFRSFRSSPAPLPKHGFAIVSSTLREMAPTTYMIATGAGRAVLYRYYSPRSSNLPDARLPCTAVLPCARAPTIFERHGSRGENGLVCRDYSVTTGVGPAGISSMNMAGPRLLQSDLGCRRQEHVTTLELPPNVIHAGSRPNSCRA